VLRANLLDGETLHDAADRLDAVATTLRAGTLQDLRAVFAAATESVRQSGPEAWDGALQTLQRNSMMGASPDVLRRVLHRPESVRGGLHVVADAVVINGLRLPRRLS
jgi:hypothetical protein